MILSREALEFAGMHAGKMEGRDLMIFLICLQSELNRSMERGSKLISLVVMESEQQKDVWVHS